MRIAVIGSGYVGLVAGACFAEIGHDVILVDKDPEKYAALVRGECPIHEQYLPELLARARGKRMSFSNTLRDPVMASEVVFMAVGTPPSRGGEADLSYVESVAREVAGAVNRFKVVVCKSTVPVYTSDWVRRVMLLEGALGDRFDVASNPEFLREGTAVTDFLYPDRIVIGANTMVASSLLRRIYQPLLEGDYYRQPDRIAAPSGFVGPPQLITTNTQSAELIKYASNAFLAMKVSFINAVATICESVDANVDDVREGIGSDARIGRRFLCPGIGYGGSCFPKDLSAYRAVARECGHDFQLLEEVMRINNDQRQRFLRKIRHALWTLKGKRIGVLGLAFKNGTDDVRESPAIAIVESLLREGAEIQAYDPAAMQRASELLPDTVRYVSSAYAAAEGADALLILTEWELFKHLDWARIRQSLRYPIVIDGRNLLDLDKMRSLNFFYQSIGRPDVVPSADQVRSSPTCAGQSIGRPDVIPSAEQRSQEAAAD
jgi:UDPglucose 6-dehydrogenase